MRESITMLSQPSGGRSMRGQRMETRIQANPFDSEAWAILLGEVQQQTPAEYRPLFERCVSCFPSAAVCWYQYIETEMRARDTEQVEALFERCLLQNPHVELWSLYVRYLRHEKQLATKELIPAYELLLGSVGADVSAGPLWMEYVKMLRDAVEPGAPSDAPSVLAARTAFQRALVQPALGLDALWKEYEAWETAQSREGAKAVLSEISDDVLVARRVARERKALVEPLTLIAMPRRAALPLHFTSRSS